MERMINFVTLFDKNYLSRGVMLFYSLRKQCKEQFTLYILAMDKEVRDFFGDRYKNNIICFSVEDMIKNYPVLLRLRKERSKGEFCWTLFDKDKGHPLNAYYEPVGKVWICENCYNDFKTYFHWTVEEISEKAPD